MSDIEHTYRDIVNLIKDVEHIDSTEKFLQVCVERISNKNLKTNEKLETIASSINMIKEFVIAEAEYARVVQRDIKKLIRIDLLKEKS